MQSIAQQKTINPNNKKPSVFRTVFPWRKNKRILHAKAMMRCFCLWQKRCACGAMRIAERVRKRSVYAQQPRFRANALHLTLRVRLLAMSAAFDFRKCKRLLLSSLAVSLRVRSPCIQKQPRLRLFFVNDEQKGASF